MLLNSEIEVERLAMIVDKGDTEKVKERMAQRKKDLQHAATL